MQQVVGQLAPCGGAGAIQVVVVKVLGGIAVAGRQGAGKGQRFVMVVGQPTPLIMRGERPVQVVVVKVLAVGRQGGRAMQQAMMRQRFVAACSQACPLVEGTRPHPLPPRSAPCLSPLRACFPLTPPPRLSPLPPLPASQIPSLSHTLTMHCRLPRMLKAAGSVPLINDPTSPSRPLLSIDVRPCPSLRTQSFCWMATPLIRSPHSPLLHPPSLPSPPSPLPPLSHYTVDWRAR